MKGKAVAGDQTQHNRPAVPGAKRVPVFKMSKPGIPVGIYEVSFESVEPTKNSQYGSGYSWHFKVIGGPQDGKNTMRITSESPTMKNACGKMISGIIGRQLNLDEECDVTGFLGQVYTAIVTDPDGTGSRVDQLLPLQK